MTDTEIERDADESWLIWRKGFMALGRNPAKFPEYEIWHHAFRMGMVTGQLEEQYQALCLVADMANREPNKVAAAALFRVASMLNTRYHFDDI